MNCRFGLKRPDEDLTELPPGFTEMVCALEIVRPGEFSSQLHLYVDDGGTREIVFTIHGTARRGPL